MRTVFRAFRILLLLIVFIAIAFYTKSQKLKSRSWSEPLQVIIYPINGDDSQNVEDYIDQLSSNTFSKIDQFLQHQARLYDLDIQQPTDTKLGQSMQKHPPTSLPPGSNFAETAWWGIKFRYWAYKNTPDEKPNIRRVRIFVHYHETEEGKKLQHSLGLDKGLIAIVHAFASTDQEQQNNIVITHELLHTVGAYDKYNTQNQPIFPYGYAAPLQAPLFPQSHAEIMAAKIPLSSTHSKMAASLDQCIIGEKTAEEINWLKSDTDN